jgi:stalled ribosome rescue protein Dom34
MSAGKGDKPRPVNKRKFDENYDAIFRSSKNRKLLDLKVKFQSLQFKTSVEGMQLLDEIEQIEKELKQE